jgi:RNA polymerase sigma-70 factor (ECF subfamily)
MNASRLRNGPGLATVQAAPEGLVMEGMSLLPELRPGAPAAVEALLDRYLEKAYGLAMSILMDNNAAEEAVRDVFLAVVLNGGRFHGNPAFPAWIYRICVEACRMRLRIGRRANAVPIEEFLPAFTEEDTHARPVANWSREVERRIPDKEIGRVIGRFTGELPEKYHLVFVLCDVRGFTCEETAQVLELTVSAVKARLHRARLCIRERVSRYLRDRRAV